MHSTMDQLYILYTRYDAINYLNEEDKKMKHALGTPYITISKSGEMGWFFMSRAVIVCLLYCISPGMLR